MVSLAQIPRGISVVIPIYNEEENAADCYTELKSVLERVCAQLSWQHEMIFVDDGSRDKTVDILLRAGAGDESLRIIQLRRNFGQTAAMAAGLDLARYHIVVTMDGDLQNDPSEIPRMIQKLSEGYDMVAGWRRNRQDRLISRKLPSKMANWLISRLTRVKLHDYGCTLKAMTHEVAKGIRLYGEMHRFIPALADEMGARICELPVNHRARKAGVSKYGISRTFRVVLDLLTVKFLLGYSKRPIHFFGALGLASGGLGALILAWITYQRFFMQVPMGNRPLLALSVMLVLIGLQFLMFGLLGEVMARTYYESQDKKIYVIRKVIGARGAAEQLDAGQQRAIG
ncbi:MAG: glycosyltransferase [Proteobacteria bacterium]|nr:MAG: glycosyltransferase [Pseudomonadota bacterium]